MTTRVEGSVLNEVVIPSPFDAHVHLRQGPLMELVVPHLSLGGINLAYVMPNLTPPLTSPSATISYLSTLKSLSPSTHFLGTLYLTQAITPEVIRDAHQKGIVGVKSYPRGVTTNSDGGVGMEGYGVFDAVFREMEKVGMVLNLHGEVPSDVDGDGTCVLDAEPRFIPHLLEIHGKFPNLKIVLEHCTTSAAVEAVKLLPANVVATITPHHLALTIDGTVSTSLGYCKPLAKYPSDRAALRQVIRDGNPKFFLGSDSAPHSTKAKLPTLAAPSDNFTIEEDGGIKEEKEVTLPSPCAAGIYTSPELLPLVATIFESSKIPLEKLPGFCSTFGREFYGFPVEKEGEGEVVLRRVVGGRRGRKAYAFGKGEWVIPFMAGESIGWEIER